MKKMITVILSFVMMFSLCACDSMDYKKAVKLYDEGNYSEALTIFESLEDYEDSKTYITDAKWNMLFNYIQENGETYERPFESTSFPISGVKSIKTSNSEGVNVYLCAISPNNITITLEDYYDTDDYSSSIHRDFLINIKKNDPIVEWEGYSLFQLYTCYTIEGFNGKQDISKFTTTTELKTDKFTQSVKDIDGNIKESTNLEDAIFDGIYKYFETSVIETSNILSDSGLPITIEDLGFE